MIWKPYTGTIKTKFKRQIRRVSRAGSRSAWTVLSLEWVEIQPGLNKGVVRWVAVADFEKGKIKYSFGFPNDSRLVKGIFPEAVK